MQYRLTLRRLVHGRNPKVSAFMGLRSMFASASASASVSPRRGLSAAVLLVGHVLQPIDHLAIQTFLDGDVRHCRRR